MANYLGSLNDCFVFSPNDKSTSTNEQLSLRQQVIKLNENETGHGVDKKIAGLTIERGKYPDAILRFNENGSAPHWEIGVDNSIAPVHPINKIINQSSILEPFTVNHVKAILSNTLLILPDNPQNDATITILDSDGLFDIHPVTVRSNTSNILKSESSVLLNLKYCNVTFHFLNNHWVIFPHTPIELTNVEYSPILNESDFDLISSNTSPKWVIIDSDFNAKAKTYILANTRFGSFNIHLPTNPNINDFVVISDYSGTFFENNLTILSKNTRIWGVPNESFILDRSNITIKMVYVNENRGWHIII